MPSERIEIPGKPVPKARPRWDGRNNRIFTPTREEEKDVARQMLPWAGRFHGFVGVSIIFYGADGRSDLDNLAKLYLDALVKAKVIVDDRKVVGLWLEKRTLDDQGKRTIIVVGDWDGWDGE